MSLLLLPLMRMCPIIFHLPKCLAANKIATKLANFEIQNQFKMEKYLSIPPFRYPMPVISYTIGNFCVVGGRC